MCVVVSHDKRLFIYKMEIVGLLLLNKLILAMRGTTDEEIGR